MFEKKWKTGKEMKTSLSGQISVNRKTSVDSLTKTKVKFILAVPNLDSDRAKENKSLVHKRKRRQVGYRNSEEET